MHLLYGKRCLLNKKDLTSKEVMNHENYITNKCKNTDKNIQIKLFKENKI